MSCFCHLHCHTEYSLLDGCNKITEMVRHAKSLDMPALAMTDHGVMYGTVQFYKACKQHDIKPLIGCEVYVSPRGHKDKEPGKDNRPYHFTLLAQNDTGYRNLLQLVSIGHLDGYYYKPRVDRELLNRYSKGLVALSGCLRGEVNDALLQDDVELARKRMGELKDIYQDNFFVELMDHGIPEQKKANQDLIRLAREMELPLVGTNDTHYGLKTDAEVQDVLVCVQTGKTLDDPKRMKFFAPEFYLKSEEEMLKVFHGLEEAVYNTQKVADRCDLKLDFDSVYLPEYPLPEGQTSPEDYLYQLCMEGFKRHFGTTQPSQEYLDRLDTELEVINGKGFPDYFLLMWDFINYARENDIPVGPGRGSAAGSLVAYLTGITQLDPLEHNLLFERFLNPERSELPDIDTDFCVERREEVIQYCRQKYGNDRVAQIITFGRMKARAAIRDVSRVLEVPLPKADKIAKTVPAGPGVSLQDALDTYEFKQLYDQDVEAKRVIDLALKVEGMARNAGIHAAGVLVSSTPIAEVVPLQRMKGNEIVAQFDMNDCAEVGMVKMDFLGLRNLTVIKNCLKLIEKSQGIKVDVEKLTYTDPKAYELMGEADTTGVFQLESDGMKRYLKRLKPNRFSDIVAFLALYRPGPLSAGVVDEFIERRHGRGSKITYPHPKLEPILEETYGFFIYQEQVMLTANILAGYTLAMADKLRKAMGKKKADLMAKHRKIFVDGAIERGVDRSVAEDIFETMEKFAAYGFNKSHSAAYAVISFQTAYLKANYRTEFMAALLTSVLDHIEKVSFFVRECQEAQVHVSAPHVNSSSATFTVNEKGIVWGMAGVRNVGRTAVDHIIEEREKYGPYKDFFDFVKRIDGRLVNRKVLEALIKCGACDDLGANRATLLENLDPIAERASKAQKQMLSGQGSLFASTNPQTMTLSDLSLSQQEEYEHRQLLEMEREMLGLYLTDSPLSKLQDKLSKNRTHNIRDLNEELVDMEVVLGVLVIEVKKIVTRSGSPMAFVTIEDLSGTIEAVVFPKTFEQCGPLLHEGAILFFRGVLEIKKSRNDPYQEEQEEEKPEFSLSSRSVWPLDSKYVPLSDQITHIKLSNDQANKLEDLKKILLKNPGNQLVMLHLGNSDPSTLKLNRNYAVQHTKNLKKDVSRLLGNRSIWSRVANSS